MASMTDDKTPTPKAAAKPAARKIAPGQVIGSDPVDTVRYSSAQPSVRRKVLTVLHLQRRLAEEGFPEAASAPGGNYEELTKRAVAQYQTSRKYEATGVLTRAQFEEIFEGDPNVDAQVDTHEDHVV